MVDRVGTWSEALARAGSVKKRRKANAAAEPQPILLHVPGEPSPAAAVAADPTPPPPAPPTPEASVAGDPDLVDLELLAGPEGPGAGA